MRTPCVAAELSIAPATFSSSSAASASLGRMQLHEIIPYEWLQAKLRPELQAVMHMHTSEIRWRRCCHQGTRLPLVTFYIFCAALVKMNVYRARSARKIVNLVLCNMRSWIEVYAVSCDAACYRKNVCCFTIYVHFLTANTPHMLMCDRTCGKSTAGNS